MTTQVQNEIHKVTQEKENRLAGILQKNNVIFAALFGSRAKGTATRKSDYDILVEFDSSISIPLSRFIRIKDNIEQIAKSNVDIVTVGGLGQKQFRNEVLNTMKVLYDKRKK